MLNKVNRLHRKDYKQLVGCYNKANDEKPEGDLNSTLFIVPDFIENKDPEDKHKGEEDREQGRLVDLEGEGLCHPGKAPGYPFVREDYSRKVARSEKRTENPPFGKPGEQSGFISSPFFFP